MTAHKLLTIATINLNNAGGLLRTIKSFEPLRTNDDIEFLFQDGQSNDDSLLVAKRFYTDAEIKSEKDSGVYDAFNRTLYRAKGVYILWINSGDEFIHTEWDSIKKSLVDYNPDIGILSVQIVDENGGVSYAYPNDNDVAKGIAHQGVIFKISKVVEVGSYDIKYRIAGDIDLILRLARHQASIYASMSVVSIFYLGGISSSVDVWPETWSAMVGNKVLPYWKKILNEIKFYLWKNFKFGRRFRLKKLALISPEREVSLYDIGAVRAVLKYDQ